MTLLNLAVPVKQALLALETLEQNKALYKTLNLARVTESQKASHQALSESLSRLIHGKQLNLEEIANAKAQIANYKVLLTEPSLTADDKIGVGVVITQLETIILISNNIIDIESAEVLRVSNALVAHKAKLNAEVVANRKASLELDPSFTPKALLEGIVAIEDHARTMPDNSDKRFALLDLAKKLKADANYFFASNEGNASTEEYKVFQNSFNTTLDTNRHVLGQHRALLKDILVNVLVCLTGVGAVALAARALYTGFKTGHANFFINGATKSQQLAESVKSLLDNAAPAAPAA
jgi:hypothetical protein